MFKINKNKRLPEQLFTISMWVIAVWIAFAAAVLLTGWGLWRMNIEQWQKYYMLVSWLFMVSSTFTLAKTVRDSQEADLLERRAASQREVAEPKPPAAG